MEKLGRHYLNQRKKVNITRNGRKGRQCLLTGCAGKDGRHLRGHPAKRTQPDRGRQRAADPN